MENQGVVVTEAHKIFTHAFALAVTETVAEALPQIAARWQRERWYFLGSERRLSAPTLPPEGAWSDEANAGLHEGAAIKHRVIGTKGVSRCWRTPELAAQIRVRWFPDPRRPKNTPVYLLVDFRRYRLLADDELQRQGAEVPVLVDPPRDAYESREAWQAVVCVRAEEWLTLHGEQFQEQEGLHKRLYIPQNTMTVRVWLDQAHPSTRPSDGCRKRRRKQVGPSRSGANTSWMKNGRLAPND